MSQNIHSMYFVKPNCLCMFCSIAFSLQQNANEHHRARFKSQKYTNVVTNTIRTELTNHYLYCLKTRRIGSAHSGNIGWVSHQFHNAHDSVLMGLRDVHTARISRMQVKWNSYRPRCLCRSLKYQEMKSIIERMVTRWSENTWKI